MCQIIRATTEESRDKRYIPKCFKEGPQLLHWYSFLAFPREKAAVVDTALKASGELQIWNTVYFSLPDIFYCSALATLSYFFCQSYAHQKVESSRKKGQWRKLQRETQCSDNISGSNEIMMAVFTSDGHHGHLSSWHLLMSVFSLCCLSQEILQTHFQLSLLCLELDP